MNKQHKWAKEIKAWADGAEIQCRAVKNTLGITTDWFDAETPQWHDNDTEYRIKPQPKEPQYLYVYKMMTNEGLKIQFWDTYTYQKEYIGKIKLEVNDE